MAESVTWVVLCNPENRRSRFFSQSLHRAGFSSPIIISYSELLSSSNISSFFADKLSHLHNKRINIKIDSAGENFHVTKALIALGASLHSQRILPHEAQQLEFEKGRFRYLKEWYLGYKQLLACVNKAVQAVSANNSVSFLNTPDAILALIDKKICQQTLLSQAISVPPVVVLPPTFDQWVDHLIKNKCYQVFLKPRYGSSAAGVIAFRINPKSKKMTATTSLQLTGTSTFSQCYNSLKLSTYQTPEDIQRIFNHVIEEDAYCEKWVTKPQVDGMNFDVRMVAINGKATHYVTRCSHSPITNLHLNNHRGNILKHHNGNQMLKHAASEVEKAATVFPGARSIGVDIITSTRRSRIIEINAFGDLLPGILYKGMSTYDMQAQSLSCY